MFLAFSFFRAFVYEISFRFWVFPNEKHGHRIYFKQLFRKSRIPTFSFRILRACRFRLCVCECVYVRALSKWFDWISSCCDFCVNRILDIPFRNENRKKTQFLVATTIFGKFVFEVAKNKALDCIRSNFVLFNYIAVYRQVLANLRATTINFPKIVIVSECSLLVLNTNRISCRWIKHRHRKWIN